MPKQVDGSMTAVPVPLSELERDLPAPAAGWAAELDRRGVAVVLDDLGRAAVDRATARALFTEHREQQEAAASRRAEIEQRAIEADQRFRASLPAGVRSDAIPAGVSAAELMMLSDPMDQGSRRESVLEHALANPDGAIIYRPIRDEQADQ
jgi:hypothetical protein